MDTQKPTFQEPLSEASVIKKDEKIEFSASDNDKISYYKVKLLDQNGHILRSWRKQKEAYYLIPEAVRDQAKVLLARAYDKAGNYTEQQTAVSFAVVPTSVGTQVGTDVGTDMGTSDNDEAVQGAETQNTQIEQPLRPDYGTPPLDTGEGETQSQSKAARWYNPFSWF